MRREVESINFVNDTKNNGVSNKNFKQCHQFQIRVLENKMIMTYLEVSFTVH
jgi:hypothetical protein